MPDGQVAEKLGRSVNAVSLRRLRLGIPCVRAPYHAPGFRPWSRSELELLGTVADREVARKLKRSLVVVRYRRCRLGIPPANAVRRIWTAEEDEILGRCSIAEAVRRLDRPYKGVQHRRERLGIRGRRAQPLRRGKPVSNRKS